MKILDTQGRLFGKISIIDIGAALVIVLVIAGIFFFPGNTGSSVAQIGELKQIEVDLIVRGLNVREPDRLIVQFTEQKKTNLIIRNQTYGDAEIIKVRQLPKSVLVPQPDGSIKRLPDPRSQDTSFSTDMLLTLAGKGQQTKNGLVLGNNKVKIGTTIELEGINYNFNASVIDVRVK
ncbi:MAG TPA: DUF4330 domain-containing protein [Allocoleopsis sp.]